jgi:glutamine---fructose-6-phosphate transaminase (isomerizing)
MWKEACEAPDVVSRQNSVLPHRLPELVKKLHSQKITSGLSVARGSSDHAAGFVNYLIMNKTGRLMASVPMSLVTLYRSPLIVHDKICLAISQSGQSPDLIEPIRDFRTNSGVTVAIVNVEDSPLATESEFVLPILAGPEKAVAATKSFIGSLTAGIHLVSHWTENKSLKLGLERLPEMLARSQNQNWDAALDRLVNSKQAMVVSRGYGLSLAHEAALKFKETCGIQAEPFSGAEIKHGPMALIENGYPLIIFGIRGPALPNLINLATEMRARGAQVIFVAPEDVKERDLTLPSLSTEEFDVVVAAQLFYLFNAKLAEARGLNPDEPRHLSKVTLTK